MEFFMQLCPGIGTFFAVEPVIAVARIVLIVFGFVLACLGFKRTLEQLIICLLYTSPSPRDRG